MSAVIQNKTEKDSRVEAAISHWAPRFVANGVPLADFQEVTASVSRWEDWCAAWSARAAIHEEMGNKALAGGYNYSAGQHSTRAAVCYHFGKFLFVNDIAQMKEAHRRAVECRKDRKSTRLNSSHTVISYAVFCLKKKKQCPYLPRHDDTVGRWRSRGR